MTSVLPASLLWGPVGRINHAIEYQVAAFANISRGSLEILMLKNSPST